MFLIHPSVTDPVKPELEVYSTKTNLAFNLAPGEYFVSTRLFLCFPDHCMVWLLYTWRIFCLFDRSKKLKSKSTLTKKAEETETATYLLVYDSHIWWPFSENEPISGNLKTVLKLRLPWFKIVLDCHFLAGSWNSRSRIITWVVVLYHNFNFFLY